MQHHKWICGLHSIIGEAIGTIAGVSMRDDVDPDFSTSLAAIADSLRDRCEKLREECQADPGPQRVPAGVGQIEAQVKQVTRELKGGAE